MIDTKALRSRVLDLAIQGKLTEQLESDGTAEELYQQIQAEKQRLVKEGKIKKEKPLPEIMPEEVPFEIPGSWKWVRLKDNCTKIIDGDHNPPKGVTYQTDYLMLSAQNIINDHIECLDKARYLTQEVYNQENERTKLCFGDILLTIVGTIGRSCVFESTEKYCFQRSVSVITTLIFNKYLKYAFDCGYSQKHMNNNATGAAQLGFYLNKLEKMIIPLPPLAEQKRIVARVEEIFRLLDTIDEAQKQYAMDVESLKAKLITAGIQGKLTEQLESDGTAEELYQQIQEEKQRLIKEGKIKKEKPLPEIKPEEVPFEIPRNWKWVRLSNIIDVRDGTHDSPKYHEEGIPLITSKNLSSGKLDFNNVKLISYEDAKKINERSYVGKGDILFAMIGTIGNPVIVDTEKEFCIKNVALFKNYSDTNFDMNFLYYYLLMEQYEMRKITHGGLQPFVSLKLFRNHLIALPPFAEQKRIAERLDAVLEALNIT